MEVDTVPDNHEDAFKSLHQVEKTTDEPLIRVMALHALAYCERLFYLEEIEEIRLADANVYSGRRLHEQLDKGAENYTVELASERLGIQARRTACDGSRALLSCSNTREESPRMVKNPGRATGAAVWLIRFFWRNTQAR